MLRREKGKMIWLIFNLKDRQLFDSKLLDSYSNQFAK